MTGIKHDPQTNKSHVLDDPATGDGSDAWNNEHSKGDIEDVVNAFTLANLNTLISDTKLASAHESHIIFIANSTEESI